MMSNEKVVLITGAGSGIGAAAARAFAREGGRIVVCDISLAAAEATVAAISDACEAIAIAADVASAADAQAMMATIERRFGRLDIAVNNAGIGRSGQPLADIPEWHFDRVLAVNLKGIWQCMRFEIPLMLRGGGGAIVNTASALGLVAMPNSAEYIAAKHGVIGLSKAASLDYAAAGIRVNAVCPGVIETPLVQDGTADPAINARLTALHPIGRLGRPEEVADAIIWLASAHSSFVTGASVAVDGGWTSQ